MLQAPASSNNALHKEINSSCCCRDHHRSHNEKAHETSSPCRCMFGVFLEIMSSIPRRFAHLRRSIFIKISPRDSALLLCLLLEIPLRVSAHSKLGKFPPRASAARLRMLLKSIDIGLFIIQSVFKIKTLTHSASRTEHHSRIMHKSANRAYFTLLILPLDRRFIFIRTRR